MFNGGRATKATVKTNYPNTEHSQTFSDIKTVGEYGIITSNKCLHSLKGAPLPFTEENITVTD